MTQIKVFKEFTDFVYLSHDESEKMENIAMVAYLKVFEDKEKHDYLNYLNIGLYFEYDKVKLEECITHILDLNYPLRGAYEMQLYSKNKQI